LRLLRLLHLLLLLVTDGTALDVLGVPDVRVLVLEPRLGEAREAEIALALARARLAGSLPAIATDVSAAALAKLRALRRLLRLRRLLLHVPYLPEKDAHVASARISRVRVARPDRYTSSQRGSIETGARSIGQQPERAYSRD